MQSADAKSPRANSVPCDCSVRFKDEEQKQRVMEEIHLAYEEILQLE
jgi:hypothetical protein